MTRFLSLVLLLLTRCGPAAVDRPADPSPVSLSPVSPSPVSPSPVSPPPVSRPPPPAAPLPPGHALVVVSATAVQQECSGAGGEHYTLTADSPGGGLFHAGGHAIYLGILPEWGNPPPAPWFVAEVHRFPPISADADDNPDSSVSGWCLDRLPRFDGEALRLVPAAGRDDAHRLLAQLQATGLPRSAIELGGATTGDELAVVRVRSHNDVSGDRAYQLELVDGDAPSALLIPAAPPRPRAHALPFEAWTGDLLVVAATGAGSKRRITRALVADDLADARRWRTALATATWPPTWMSPGWSGAFRTARWAAVGKVVAGKTGCGDELEITTYAGTSFVLDPMRVAAPPGVSRGDVVTAILLPTEADRCGRRARVVRAYATPGATAAYWITGGEPVPSTAILE